MLPVYQSADPVYPACFDASTHHCIHCLRSSILGISLIGCYTCELILHASADGITIHLDSLSHIEGLFSVVICYGVRSWNGRLDRSSKPNHDIALKHISSLISIPSICSCASTSEFLITP